jgi:hypothetical protein
MSVQLITREKISELSVSMNVPDIVSASVLIGLVLRQVMWVQEEKERERVSASKKAFATRVIGF